MAQAAELDGKQAAYKAAVEDGIAAIREEEALASVAHDVAEIDRWEGGSFQQDQARGHTKKTCVASFSTSDERLTR